MNETNRLKGSGEAVPAFYKSLNVRSLYDNSYITWLSSPVDISAVRLSDFTFKTVNNFWIHRNSNVSPLGVVLGKNGDRIYGLGEIQDQVQTLHCYTNKSVPVVFELD